MIGTDFVRCQADRLMPVASTDRGIGQYSKSRRLDKSGRP